MTTQHDQPYDNPATQDERKAIVKNDTLFTRQQNTIDDAAGRYAKLHPAKIVGSTPAPYPEQPANSPWHHDPVPATEPLGFSVDELPPNSGGGQTDDVVGVASSSPADDGSIAPSAPCQT